MEPQKWRVSFFSVITKLSRKKYEIFFFPKNVLGNVNGVLLYSGKLYYICETFNNSWIHEENINSDFAKIGEKRRTVVTSHSRSLVEPGPGLCLSLQHTFTQNHLSGSFSDWLKILYLGWPSSGAELFVLFTQKVGIIVQNQWISSRRYLSS